jgi:hypothetical protein
MAENTMSKNIVRSRRAFFNYAAAAAMAAAAPAGVLSAAAPSNIARIKSAVRREDTIIRLGGDGHYGDITWTSDDRQLVTALDGAGWPAPPKGYYTASKMNAISGEPSRVTIDEVPGYPFLSLYELTAGIGPTYYGYGTLAVDDTIYQFHPGFRVTFDVAHKRRSGYQFEVVKLIYSKDNGRTWRNQDGSSPVVWETPQEQNLKSMIFMQEPGDTFCWPRVLQMGRAYSANVDGFVYIYSPNGSSACSMRQLVMARVPKNKVLDRRAYEFFAGIEGNGRVNWSDDIRSRQPIHEFPPGWHPENYIAFSWTPSMVYNPSLGIYMMASSGFNPLGPMSVPSGPNYLGLWVAPNPWGPWKQIHEEHAWLTAGDHESRPFEPVISPKWISKDGKSFWLIWSDLAMLSKGHRFSPETHGRVLNNRTGEVEYHSSRAAMRTMQPNYGFNGQRIDLQMG